MLDSIKMSVLRIALVHVNVFFRVVDVERYHLSSPSIYYYLMSFYIYFSLTRSCGGVAFMLEFPCSPHIYSCSKVKLSRFIHLMQLR